MIFKSICKSAKNKYIFGDLILKVKVSIFDEILFKIIANDSPEEKTSPTEVNSTSELLEEALDLCLGVKPIKWINTIAVLKRIINWFLAKTDLRFAENKFNCNRF